MKASKIIAELKAAGDPAKAEFFTRFFKSGKGEYAYGDKFIGTTVPNIRKAAKKYKDIPFSELQKLIQSPLHEIRLLSVIILTLNVKKDVVPKEVYQFYLKNLKYVNNWDIVDSSCHKIMGPYLIGDPKKNILYKFSRSKDLWERRISIITTYYFIKRDDYKDALKIAYILKNDEHDLIHKAVGWMLREIGNRHLGTEEEFLKEYYSEMPRTMLRYAIEKFPEKKRKLYLQGKI